MKENTWACCQGKGVDGEGAHGGTGGSHGSPHVPSAGPTEGCGLRHYHYSTVSSSGQPGLEAHGAGGAGGRYCSKTHSDKKMSDNV